tara:strand:- start:392 stop:763 length:372 start_codon:yes stop_codon:yes gene_type:complete
MFKSKYTIAGILLLILISISNIFSIVYVEYNSVSLVEFREHRIECGPLLDILQNNIDYSKNSQLSMNRFSCKQIAMVTLLSSITSILFLIVVLFIIIKLIKNKTEVEDISDLLNILKSRNRNK